MATPAKPVLQKTGLFAPFGDYHQEDAVNEEGRAHAARLTILGTLAASIAHELNQSLCGMATNAETCLRMLANSPPNVDGARETARRAIRDVNRASEVISGLRALVARQGPRSDTVDLNHAVHQMLALSESSIRKSGVKVRAELEEELPLVSGDLVQLQQVILNLVTNALDAMQEVADRRKELIVRTERCEADCVVVSVRDSGIGLEPQMVGQLFEAFYTTKKGGVGIGLSISRSIIESHHGHLWAAQNDGPGATFAFSVPLVQPESELLSN